MSGIFAARRMLRNSFYSLCSSVAERTSSSSNPAATSSFSSSVTTKPTWSLPVSKFNQPSIRNHFSSGGESKVLAVESADQLNSVLRKVQDESLQAVFYFTAAWCGPCRFISPLIGELSEQYTNVPTYKIDIDQEGLRGALEKLDIAAVPTLHFFQGGKKVSEIVGADIQRLKTTMEDLYK